MISKVLIANRGEIAVRIIRACKEMGIETVAVYSTADKDSLHVKMADQAVCVGEPQASGSYLHISNIIASAKTTGADAIHPGYGFLAENAFFAEMCRANDLNFIGPSVKTIQTMGDKISARKIALEAGAPVVPGSDGGIKHLDETIQIAEQIGYPVLIKASAGGGGRGMRMAHNKKDLETAVMAASREAEAAFGNGEVYIEKYIEEPRHIEIQVLGDMHGNLVYLGERDCSIQRRNQKLLEECPSPFVDAEMRSRMGEAAINVARAAGYYSAGTIEFLVDKYKNFYFIEMNTRIQVEHPVTEMVTGIDLVKAQLAIAAGEPLAISQADVKMNGWAIECRINAEDPASDFRPSAGTITGYQPAGGPGVRVDSFIYAGYTISPHYDSLVGKLIVWAPDREQAINRMQRALQEHSVEGIKTTIPFHLKVLNNGFFRKGEIYTNFITRRMSDD